MALRTSLFALLSLLILLSGCRTETDPDALVVYSGRSQALVDAFVHQYRDITERNIQVRYGRDAELLAALEEEGARSPADLFWANTAGALRAAGEAGLLVPLPDGLLREPEAFVPASGLWIPLTVRFRVLAFAPERVAPNGLPRSVMALPDADALRGRVGWTPTYSSFQDFVTAIRILHGDDEARAWLEGMRGLAPRSYPANAPMLEALAAGEIDVALTNHYYILRVKDAGGPRAAGVETHYFAPGDVGNLALVTGAGVLATAEYPQPALAFLEYLISTGAQSRAAGQVFEYPVVRGADVPPGSISFDEALQLSPELDYDDLTDLEGTLRLLRDVGIL